MSIQVLEVSSPADAEAVANFFQGVWQGDEAVVPMDQILAVLHVGGYCSFIEGEHGIQAASFGFRGEFSGRSILHSHVTASLVPGLGFELKQHQKNWAVAANLEGITWTFDPLVRRNAVFNFEKLGATAVEYLPNFYGTMSDSINRGDESDRLFVYWPVAGVQPWPNKAGANFLVPLPEDIEALRQNDPEAASEWRMRVRKELMPLFESGAVIRSMTPDRKALIVESVAG